MKRNFIIFLASLGFTGCGAPDWSGEFVGAIKTTGNCTEGPIDAFYSETVSLVNNGATVQLVIGIGSQCSWIADIHDDKANVRQTTCTLMTEEGHSLIQKYSVRDGTLTLDGDTLDMELNRSSELWGSVNQMCDYTQKGSFERQ